LGQSPVLGIKSHGTHAPHLGIKSRIFDKKSCIFDKKSCIWELNPMGLLKPRIGTSRIWDKKSCIWDKPAPKLAQKLTWSHLLLPPQAHRRGSWKKIEAPTKKTKTAQKKPLYPNLPQSGTKRHKKNQTGTKKTKPAQNGTKKTKVAQKKPKWHKKNHNGTKKTTTAQTGTKKTKKTTTAQPGTNRHKVAPLSVELGEIAGCRRRDLVSLRLNRRCLRLNRRCLGVTRELAISLNFCDFSWNFRELLQLLQLFARFSNFCDFVQISCNFA
jgi:hypothetical protein